MIWLARLFRDYYRNAALFEKLNCVTGMEILKECYALEPDNEAIQDMLLKSFVEGISYSVHEWPAGILWGNNGATEEECNILLDEIPLIHKLDRKNEHSEFIKDYEDKINEYKKRF